MNFLISALFVLFNYKHIFDEPKMIKAMNDTFYKVKSNNPNYLLKNTNYSIIKKDYNLKNNKKSNINLEDDPKYYSIDVNRNILLFIDL